LGQKLKMIVQDATSLQPIAWIPEVLQHLDTLSSGRVWAG
jgi:hypothetical protein